MILEVLKVLGLIILACLLVSPIEDDTISLDDLEIHGEASSYTNMQEYEEEQEGGFND